MLLISNKQLLLVYKVNKFFIFASNTTIVYLVVSFSFILMATCIGLFSDQHQAISTEKLRSETKEHPQLHSVISMYTGKEEAKISGI